MVEISNIGQNNRHCLYIQLYFLEIHIMKSLFNYDNRTDVSKALC